MKSEHQHAKDMHAGLVLLDCLADGARSRDVFARGANAIANAFNLNPERLVELDLSEALVEAVSRGEVEYVGSDGMRVSARSELVPGVEVVARITKKGMQKWEQEFSICWAEYVQVDTISVVEFERPVLEVMSLSRERVESLIRRVDQSLGVLGVSCGDIMFDRSEWRWSDHKTFAGRFFARIELPLAPEQEFPARLDVLTAAAVERNGWKTPPKGLEWMCPITES